VGKKEKNCDRADPADDFAGDHWDHVAFDPEHRLVASVVTGRCSEDHTRLLVEDFHARTGGRVMDPMTSDEYQAYTTAILDVYREEVQPPRQGTCGRHPAPGMVPPEELVYATVHKRR
jgi:hypothetical protein